MGQRNEDRHAYEPAAASNPTMKSFNRSLLVAAALPTPQARAVVALLCAQKQSHPMEKNRNKLAKDFHRAVVRVVKFVKHETLRKLHRHLYSNRPITGQEQQHHDSIRIAFNLGGLKQDLNSVLRTEIPTVLNAGTQDTLDAAGYRDPWKLPAQEALDFIAARENLLSDVPDEVFQTIQAELSAGLNAGESIAQLSARISAAFDEIEAGRAEVIADTETAAAYSYSSDQAARAAGVEYKKWLHGATSKVPRPDHVAIDGLVVPMDEPYPVGSPPLMYPHDENGAPEDIINCSCISIPTTREEFESQ